MFKEKVNGRTDGRTDGRPHARTDGRTTDTGPWHKLAGLRPVELKTAEFKGRLFCNTSQQGHENRSCTSSYIYNCTHYLNRFLIGQNPVTWRKPLLVIFQWTQWDYFGFSCVSIFWFYRSCFCPISTLLLLNRYDADKFILWIEKNMR